MRTLLVLARGDGRTYRDLSGTSIFAAIPHKILLFVDRGNLKHFRDLEGDVEIHVVRWNAPATVIDAAVQLAKDKEIFAVSTLDEELVDLAANLRERLGVPGLHPAEVSRFRDKVAMKHAAALAGIRTPEFRSCTNREAVAALLTRHGKIVVKPVRGQGSRGVAFVSGLAELDAWYAASARADEYEAEEFVEGVLYHVNAIVHEGRSLLTASAPYLPGMGNIDFGAGTPFVTVIEEDPRLSAALTAFSDRVIAALELTSGVTHLECFVTPRGEIVFCEVGIRPGGGGIVWMIEAQHGVNFNRAALLLESGHGHELGVPATSLEGVAGLVGFRSARSGFVHEAARAEDFPEEWIHVRTVNVGGGAFKSASAHCTDFWGLLVFSSRNRAEFDDRVKQLRDRFSAALRTQAA